MAITVEQAREKLSKEDNEKYSDAEVQSIIDDSYKLANIAIDQYLAEKNVKRRDS
jgi:hypothetical protein